MSAEELLKYMLNFFQDIDTRLVELRNKQSKWDKKQDELLHYIENHKMDAIKSCKAVKLFGHLQVKSKYLFTFSVSEYII